MGELVPPRGLKSIVHEADVLQSVCARMSHGIPGFSSLVLCQGCCPPARLARYLEKKRPPISPAWISPGLVNRRGEEPQSQENAPLVRHTSGTSPGPISNVCRIEDS